MEHLDLAGVLTTPPQWNLPAFEQQDAIYLSSSRQMLEPIMEETSEDEEYALNSWQQYDNSNTSDVESVAPEGLDTSAGGESAAGGASFWSSAESDTGSVIRIEVTKDNDSTSERDFLCPAKRPRRCEESNNTGEDEVVLRRPNVYNDFKNNSLERFLNYDLLSRDSWGAQSQQRSSLGSRRGFDDFYSDSDSLSYNSLSRSSSLIQFESLERQLLVQEQHASMTSLGNSSPSLLSFDLQTGEDNQAKAASNSGNSSANNSRRGSQSSLLKKYESLDGRLHQTYYDLDKLNFDDMHPANNENFSLTTNLKISSHMAELRSDSESSSEGSDGSSRPQSVLSPADINDNEFFLKKYQRCNSQQSKKGKSSAENLSEDSGYCEPSLGFGLRKTKSQNLLNTYEKFSEEDEEMENKSILSAAAAGKQQPTFNELNIEQAKQHSTKTNEFKNTNTRQDVTKAETPSTPPLSPHLEFKRHKQRTEAHSPSPVSSEVSTSSSISSTKSTSNNSTTSSSASSSSSSSSSAASSTSSATTCASKASFTWLMPSSGRTNSRVYDQHNDHPQISINDLSELKTSHNENVENFSGKLENLKNSKDFPITTKNLLSEKDKLCEQFKENECLECKNLNLEQKENFTTLCRNCGEFQTKINLKCNQCKHNESKEFVKDLQKSGKENLENRENLKNSENLLNSENLNCENCGEKFLNNTAWTNTERFLRGEALRKFQYTKSFSCENLQNLREENENSFRDLHHLENLDNKRDSNENSDHSEHSDHSDHSLEYDSAVSTPESIKRLKSYENSPKNLRKYKNTQHIEQERLESNNLDHSLEYTSASSTPETARRLFNLDSPNSLRNCAFPTQSSDSDYSPLRLRKNLHNLMLSWPAKTSSVPNELDQLGRKKKLKKSLKTIKAQKKPSKSPKSFNSQNKDYESPSESLSSAEDFAASDCVYMKRSSSWNCQISEEIIEPRLQQDPSFYPEARNLGLLHQSYHNLALLDLDLETKELTKLPEKIMADKRKSSDYETEIVCKNNFLLDELSAHYDRTASILNDKPMDVTDSLQKPNISTPPAKPQRLRKSSNSSYSEKELSEEEEQEQVQHVQLVIRKPPARQKKEKDEEKSNSLTYDFTFSNIMKGGGAGGTSGQKTFDQDPTNLKTSYAQSLEKCNFDCKEISNQDLNKARSIPKRRFHSQAGNSKKKNMVSSTPNLNAFDFNQDEIEDDMFVSSAHTSMHQLPLSQTQKPLGILLPAGSRTSFGKEVSFCPVVSKYCWQEQSSEECNDGTEEILDHAEDSEDELLDNADATVIYNTKENENIANKFNEEFLKKEQQNVYQEENGLSKEKTLVREDTERPHTESETKHKQDLTNEESVNKESVNKEHEHNGKETQEQRETQITSVENETHTQEPQIQKLVLESAYGIEIAANNLELESAEVTAASNELLPVTTISLTTNVNNETVLAKPDIITSSSDQNKRVNSQTSPQQSPTKPTVVVARPLSIQLPILSEPPINRAHHILYASQQMLDNFQKQQQNEEYEHYKSQSTQNLSKMSTSATKTNEGLVMPSMKNNNNEVMKSKFKHEEKHPNSKGFLSRFANGFRFSLRRNKKKLHKDGEDQTQPEDKRNSLPTANSKTNGSAPQQNLKSKSLPSANKQPDFIHIPLKGPLPAQRYGNTQQQTQLNGNTTNGNNNKNTTVVPQKKGAKTKDSKDENKQKVTGKPPIPPQQQQQQQQQFLKMQSAQSAPQQQQQPLVEVGFSRFYTETNTPENFSTPAALVSSTQDFLTTERFYNQNNPQSCANIESIQTPSNDFNNSDNNENIMSAAALNTNPAANYEFAASPSRATVSQKTQMFNNLSRNSDQHQQLTQQSQQQPKIGLIETNLDTHETVITGKTRSLINIGPNHHYQPQQKLYAGNKRLHHNNHLQHNITSNSHHHPHGGEDEDYYDDNDDDEVVVRPDGTVVVIKNAGCNNASSSQAQQIASVRRPHKSMEFLLDKENQKDVMTTSEESHTELKTNEFLKPCSKTLRKKKLRRSLTWKKDNSLVETNAIFSTDSDSDCKSQNLKMLNCTLPKTKKCSNYVKKLLFKTINSSATSESNTISSITPELSILELDRSLIRQVNSPSKIKTAYTLTVMSSPSPHSESDFCESDLPRLSLKEASRSWPSLLEVGMDEDSNLLKDKSVTTEFTDLAKSKLEQEQQKLLMDSFIDQGFETGSNDMESPMRLPRKPPMMSSNKNATFEIENKSLTNEENPKNFSTPDKDRPVQKTFTAQINGAPHNLISPISPANRRPSSLIMQSIQEDISMEDSDQFQHTPSSLNESATFFSNEPMPNITETPLSKTHKVESSQFWISAGEFTAAIAIQPYESERLMLLSNIFAQKSLETKEMNFGIDEHKFCINNSAASEDIVKKLPKEANCSQYWFSTGDVLIPFKGKQMSAKKIQAFFNYILEFVEDSGSLRFGIDTYEFSNIYQQSQNCPSHLNSNTWSQAASSLKTSDLDQSDVESEEFEQSISFSALSGNHSDTASLKSDDILNHKNNYSPVQAAESLEQIFEDARLLNLSKTHTDKLAQQSQFTVPEMLKTLQHQQLKLKSLEERMLNCAKSSSQKHEDINESPEYMRKLRSIISAIDNIGRGNGFNACSIEQLESFMFFLSRYADLCLANCTAHIEKILDVVMTQRSYQA